MATGNLIGRIAKISGKLYPITTVVPSNTKHMILGILQSKGSIESGMLVSKANQLEQIFEPLAFLGLFLPPLDHNNVG